MKLFLFATLQHLEWTNSYCWFWWSLWPLCQWMNNSLLEGILCIQFLWYQSNHMDFQELHHFISTWRIRGKLVFLLLVVLHERKWIFCCLIWNLPRFHIFWNIWEKYHRKIEQYPRSLLMDAWSWTKRNK